jgi:hypothetical protein
VVAAAVVVVASLATATVAQPAEAPPLVPTPQLECGPGSHPETGLSGRVSRADHESGRAAEGYWCNAELIGTHVFSSPATGNPYGSVAGFKVWRYVDEAGHECAYYDSTLMFPTNLGDLAGGVIVLDMADPANPVMTERLVTPGMTQPHESVVLSEERGILAAALGTLATAPGQLDLYDVTDDCRHPALLSSTPSALLGHESGIAPDGMTYYSAGTATGHLVPVDISNPLLPVPLTVYPVSTHGLSISDDGTRAYIADTAEGLSILDISEVQARVPNPTIRVVSTLDWPSRSIPQNALPFTRDGHPYLLEIDEYGAGSAVGAGRIIDIGDETNPHVVSNLRLDVHQPEHFDEIADDPQAFFPIQGYAGHYCSLPTRVDPVIAACSMILSGLRVYDITDLDAPVEIAYFNAPIKPRDLSDVGGTFEASNWAMSMPAWVPERNEVWYSDGFQGFFAVRIAEEVWPEPLAASDDPADQDPDGQPDDDQVPVTPVTGSDLPTTGIVLLGLFAMGALAGRRSLRKAP